MPGPYRLLFLDLDGTLVGKTDRITDRTRDALHRAQQAGCTLVVCTGRSRHTSRRIAEQIGGHGYIILHNGAMICDWCTGEVVQRKTLPLELARRTVSLIHQFDMAPLVFGVEEEDRWVYTDSVRPLRTDWAAANGDRLVHRENLEYELVTRPISVTTYGPEDLVRPLTEQFRQELGPQVSILESGTRKYASWCLEVYPVGTDKAKAAQIVARLLNVPREQTMAIGDHLNDLELLRWAGLGVAMEDGEPDVVRCADWVTGGLEQDGAAQAIERLVL